MAIGTLTFLGAARTVTGSKYLLDTGRSQVLIDAGISAIVQPGGSVRDDEVIAAARAANVTMFFTGERHFFH